MEFTAQPKRVLPLILLADTSSSMREWMRELNTAIRDMLGTLKEQESLKAEIHIFHRGRNDTFGRSIKNC